MDNKILKILGKKILYVFVISFLCYVLLDIDFAHSFALILIIRFSTYAAQEETIKLRIKILLVLLVSIISFFIIYVTYGNGLVLTRFIGYAQIAYIASILIYFLEFFCKKKSDKDK